MKTSNLLSRTITCVVGILAIAALIFFLPQHHFIGFSVLVILSAFAGSLELSSITIGRKTFFSYASFITVIVSYVFSRYTELCLALLIFTVLAFEIKKGEKDTFRDSAASISLNILVLIYPSYFLSFLVRLVQSENVNEYVISLFLLLVFSNDIFAYIFGMLFGKNNAGLFKASPKKSIAGFVGGTIGCIGVCFLFFAFFGEKMIHFSVYSQFLLGLGSSITANIGDLAESVLKRSCNVKDSGSIIPGRGGVLDCTDSIMTASLLFYIVYAL